MPRDPSHDEPIQGVELGSLLASSIGAVVDAQQRMDEYTLRRKQEFEKTPEGNLALPPLWYVFDKVSVEMELSTIIRSDERVQPLLYCQTLNPTTVGLYGYQAAAGLKVRMQLGPRGNLPLKNSQDIPRPGSDGNQQKRGTR
jgi:hypothetical protein